MKNIGRYIGLAISCIVMWLGIHFLEQAGFISEELSVTLFQPIMSIVVFAAFLFLILGVIKAALGERVGGALIMTACTIVGFMAFGFLINKGYVTLPLSISLFLSECPWVMTLLIIAGINLMFSLVNLLVAICVKHKKYRKCFIIITAISFAVLVVIGLIGVFWYTFQMMLRLA